MKKSIALCLFYICIIVSISAMDLDIGIMGSGGVNLSVGKKGTELTSYTNLKQMMFSGGGGVYLNLQFGFVGFMPEVFYVANKGVHFKDEDGYFVKYQINTLDIPVLLTLQIGDPRSFSLLFVIGPRFSFPLTRVLVEELRPDIVFSGEHQVPIFLYGVIGGVDLIGKIGNGTFLSFGIRYGHDFVYLMEEFRPLALADIHFKLGLQYRILGKK